LQADKQPDHNRFIRSDQYSSFERGAGVGVQVWVGAGTPEERNSMIGTRNGITGRRMIDSAVDQAAAAQFNAILGKLAVRVADETERPRWNAESFFSVRRNKREVSAEAETRRLRLPEITRGSGRRARWRNREGEAVKDGGGDGLRDGDVLARESGR